MSKRLQVLLDESELRDIQRIARRQRVTVAEWVDRIAGRPQGHETDALATARKLVAGRRGGGALPAVPPVDGPL